MTNETDLRQSETSRSARATTTAASLAGRLLVGLEQLARWSARQLTQPRVRNAVIGVVMILIGAFVVTAPFWAFALIVAGLLMVVTSWVGSRLEGRFVIEWDDSGAGFEMQARFKANRLPDPTALVPAPAPRGADEAGSEPGETIDGEAHTVEIDADELRALVAAVDALQATNVGQIAGTEGSDPERPHRRPPATLVTPTA